MSNFVTAEEFRAMPLGVSLKQFSDEQLDSLIEVAQANVESLCDRHFASAYYTEEWMGDGTAVYITEEYPVIQVLEMTQIDPSAGTEVDLDVTKLVLLPHEKSAGILRLNGFDVVTTFDVSYKYQVYYRAGFTTVPVAIKHATKLWTAELLQPDFAGVNSNVPDVIPLTSEQITELLTPYRRIRI